MKDSAEDELLLPQDSPATHLSRLIDFPRNFDQRLRDVPRQVARATMTMLGRIAGGEPARICRRSPSEGVSTVTRLRIGIDWRLLFRLLQDRIEVVDLIHVRIWSVDQDAILLGVYNGTVERSQMRSKATAEINIGVGQNEMGLTCLEFFRPEIIFGPTRYRGGAMSKYSVPAEFRTRWIRSDGKS